jgi:hypothetical protein
MRWAIYGGGILKFGCMILRVMFSSNDHPQQDVAAVGKMEWITPKIWLMGAVDTKSGIQSGQSETASGEGVFYEAAS